MMFAFLQSIILKLKLSDNEESSHVQVACTNSQESFATSIPSQIFGNRNSLSSNQNNNHQQPKLGSFINSITDAATVGRRMDRQCESSSSTASNLLNSAIDFCTNKFSRNSNTSSLCINHPNKQTHTDGQYLGEQPLIKRNVEESTNLSEGTSSFQDTLKQNQSQQKASPNSHASINTIIVDYDKVDDYDPCPPLTLGQFVNFVCDKRPDGLSSDYEQIVDEEIYVGHEFNECLRPENYYKNRYFNVKCYDQTRVILDPSDDDETISDSQQQYRDYINANYVDGYKQARAYISTQGPLRRTTKDFWRMVWQTGSRIIVMVTQATEDEKEKCNIYWPTESDCCITYGNYSVRCKERKVDKHFILTRLELTSKSLGTSRDIWHFQFCAWPDFGVPQSAEALLKFRECVLKKQSEILENCLPYPPIIVHCSAGVGRTGTFITVDISIQKFETTGMIDVRGIVKKLRAQRYMSIQTNDQYVFCHYAILEYAHSCGLLREFADKLSGKFKIE